MVSSWGKRLGFGSSQRRQDVLTAYLCLLPWLIGFVVFVVGPMLFSLGVLFVFGIGGLTGLYLATLSTDLYLHDTYFVVGHFHLTMAAAVFLGSFASIYFWFPKMFGRMQSELLGKLHFWFSFIPINLIFGGMLIVGNAGMQRRLYNPSEYTLFQHLQPMNRWISYAAFVLFFGQIFFIINFVGQRVWTFRRKHPQLP